MLGDPERACTRFRELAEEACKTLSVERLNTLSLLIAGNIDYEFGRPLCKALIIDNDITIEQEAMKSRSRMEKRFR